MSETNKKKPSINPGLVRSDSDYKQSKSSAISNPTKQLAVVALPTAEKESTFTEMYADSLKLTWLPMTADNIVIPLEITDKAEAKPKRVKAESKSETKHAAKTKFDKIEKVKPEKIAEVKPTDMEILMANTPILQEPVKEKSALQSRSNLSIFRKHRNAKKAMYSSQSTQFLFLRKHNRRQNKTKNRKYGQRKQIRIRIS